jgi:sulfonate transport system permease protein
VRLELSERRSSDHPIVPRWIRRLVVPVLVFALWQAGSTFGWIDSRTFASPAAVLSAGLDLARTGELQAHLLASLFRVAAGLALGVTAGLVLATFAGLFRLGEDAIDPPMQMLRTLPALALIPLFILWFGIYESSKVLLIAFGTVFPIYLNTHAGIRNVDERLVEAGRTVGLSRASLVGHVILPGALPSFLVGLRFSLGTAWLILVVSEQINATSGIGYLMTAAREFYRTDIILFGLMIYAALGFATDLLVRTIERSALSWRRGFTGT